MNTKYEFSNEMLRLWADDEFIYLSLNKVKFDVKLPIDAIKKAGAYLLNSIQRNDNQIEDKN